MRNFALGIPTCWYLKIIQFALPPRQTPNASQWYIGGGGFSGSGARVGHVHFMLFVSISFALGTQRKRVFSVIWAFDYSADFQMVCIVILPFS